MTWLSACQGKVQKHSFKRREVYLTVWSYVKVIVVESGCFRLSECLIIYFPRKPLR